MNLYGWDTGYATTINHLNKALADPKGVLSSFSLTEQGMTVQGQFGQWRIIEGGAGQLLHLQTAIASGTISGDGAADAELSGISVQLEINLQFLPSELPNHKKLAFNFKHVGKTCTPSGPGVVTPLRVIDPNQRLNFTQTAVLGPGIARCLVDKAPSISFAFAELNLVPPNAADSWLTPVECAYAYYETGGGASYLVILSTTNKRDTTNLPREVDPNLISGGGDGFFAISESQFLQHVILPVLPKVYSGTDVSYFKFEAKDNTIRNSKAIRLAGIKKGAITYHPKIDHLAITVSGSTVESVASGSCDMKMGIRMTFKVAGTSAASFNAATAQLSLAKDPHPRISHKAKIPWYLWIMGPIPDIILAIVVPIVADGIAEGLDAAVKKMSFVKAGPQNVQWPGMKQFTITGGGLNGGFQLSGTAE